MNRLFKFIFCSIIPLFLMTPLNSYALNNVNISMNCDNLNPVESEEFTVSFIINADEKTNISAYRFKVNFDSSKLVYKGLYSTIGNYDFKTYLTDGCLTLLYVTSETGITVEKNINKNLFELNFKVLSTAGLGTTKISAVVDDLCDYDANEIPDPDIAPVDITISESEPGNCDLTFLEVPGYQITPAFSPDVTKYYVEVPYSKNTIEFNAIAADPDATIKISRKTLKSAGSNTDVNITVVSSDKKSRKVYTVTVNRLSKEDTDLKIKVSGDVGVHADFDNDSNPNSNNGTNDLANANNIALHNGSDPLVVKENGFDPISFAIISIIFVIIAVIIIKNKKH